MKEHISITMGADIAALRKAMEQATSLVQTAMSHIKSIVLGVGAVIGIGLGFKSIADGIGEAVRRGKELDSLARESGRTAEEIAILQAQTERAGTSMADAADIAKELAVQWRNAGMGSTFLGDELAYLGLSMDKLRKLTAPEQFDEIAQAINEIVDPVMRAKIAVDLFGSAGAKAVANYQKGDLNTAARLLGKNAMELAAAAKAMASINDAWNRIKKAGEVFFNAIAVKVAPILSAAVARLEEVLPAINAWGTKIGDAINTSVTVLFNAFKGGELFTLLGKGLDVVWQASKSALGAAFMAAVQFLNEALSHVFDVETVGGVLVNSFLYAVNKLASALVSALLGAAAVFIAAFEAGVHKVLGLLPDSFIKAIGGDPDAIKKDAAVPFGERVGREANVLGEQLGMDKWKADIEANAESAAKATKDAFNKTDWSGMWANIAKAGKDGWDANSEGLKGALDDWAKFIEHLKTPLKGLATAGKRPGEEGGKMKIGVGPLGAYDEFRRIGGGIGGAVQNVQQRMYDKLALIAASSQATVTGIQKLVDKNTKGGGGHAAIGGMELKTVQ